MSHPDDERLPFADLSPGSDAKEIREAIDRVLARGWYILGPEVEAFESEFASASGAKYAIGVANGTDAIALALRASGVEPGDEVIVPAMTATFTALAVVAAGAIPVFADIDPRTLTLDARSCAEAITPRTRAIVPVHLYGQAADIQIQAEQILKDKDNLIGIMAKCTGQTKDRIREDSERDRFFFAKEAVTYGIVDEVLGEDTDPAVAAAAADANKPK